VKAYSDVYTHRNPWLWLTSGFGLGLNLDHLWLWISFGFGYALPLAQLWLDFNIKFKQTFFLKMLFYLVYFGHN